MRERIKNVEEILKITEGQLGEDTRPMILISKLIPQWIPKQAQERKFAIKLPHIPPKYKHLIMIGAAMTGESHHCTETFIKLAGRAGVTKEEMAERIFTTGFSFTSITFATAMEGMALSCREGKIITKGATEIERWSLVPGYSHPWDLGSRIFASNETMVPQVAKNNRIYWCTLP
jgi:alkylhydroperoxidase/carboxymuconolactone decarboxylase family protein YurZ